MKKKILLLFMVLLLIPTVRTYAADFNMENGKKISGSYAGAEEYNYYCIKPSSSGFIAINVKTSDKQPLFMDICDADKNVVASDISVPNKKTVLHTAEKGKVCYIRIKGTEGASYTISYKIQKLSQLKYAKKTSYLFTNASFNNETCALYFKMKSNQSGILHFMFDTDSELNVKFVEGKKTALSDTFTVSGHSLSGIGINAKKTVYAKVWKSEATNAGVTSLNGVKYQVDFVNTVNASNRGKARKLRKGAFTETLVPAGKKTVSWFKINNNKAGKLSITVESRMLQNKGKNLRLYICNASGKKLNSDPIIISGETSVIYKKKYVMKYPETTFGTTAKFPKGTYYILVESKTKKSSGSYRIKWQ
ncbi:MAG: hypothetical protein E7271_13050 [Lachnospiraceae bacterium]|nr:hypothetical protein [Lachnospiraceae bacterium]